jgi:hypothetical protein
MIDRNVPLLLMLVPGKSLGETILDATVFSNAAKED